MFQKLAIALEKIQYQHNSPLFRDTTSLCQALIDKVNKDPHFATASEMQRHDTVVNVLYELDFSKALKDIVKKYLNLTIEAVLFFKTNIMNVMVRSSYELLDFGTLSTLMDSKKDTTPKSKLEEYRQFISEVTKQIDSTAGVFKEDLKNYYHIKLYITTGMFTFHQRFPNVNALTGREFAAILLHELGHVFTIFESYCQAIEKAIYLRKFVDMLGSTITKEELIDLIAVIKKEFGRACADEKINEMLEMLEILHAEYQRLSKQLPSDFILYAITLILLASVGSIYASDVIETDLMSIECERIADEWAASHGCSADLISALTKWDAVDFTGSTKKTARLVNKTLTMELLTNTVATLKRLGLYRMLLMNKIYDKPMRRLELLIHDATEELKNTELPAEIRNELIATVTRSRNLFAEYKNSPYVKQYSKFFENLRTLTKPFKLKTWFGSTLQQDYQLLQETTNDILKTPFAYQAARIKSLSDGRK